MELEIELREFYLEAIRGRVILHSASSSRMGKADGFKVLDVANPQSFQEFILEDFDNSRIPL